jgi:hypothetical protein
MTTASDAILLGLFKQWKLALADEVFAQSEHESNAAHAQLRTIEDTIRMTLPEGITGIAIKFGLALFIGGERHGVDAELSKTAYEDLCSLAGRDFAAEAEAVVKRRAA